MFCRALSSTWRPEYSSAPVRSSVTGHSRIPDAQDMAILKLLDSLGDWLDTLDPSLTQTGSTAMRTGTSRDTRVRSPAVNATSILSIEYFRDGSGCKRRRPGHQQPGRRLVRQFGRPFLGDMA